MAQIRPITLAEYNKRYGEDRVAPLYVLNRTNPKGHVAFNCLNDMNQTVPVIVPATFIPVDLTTIVPRDNLMNSAYFRKLLNNMKLVVMDNKEAEDFLRNNARARAEHANLNNISEDAQGLIDIDADDNSKSLRMEDQSLSQNNFVNALIERASGDESDENLEREFLVQMDTLTKADLVVLRKNVNRPSLAKLIIEALEDFDA